MSRRALSNCSDKSAFVIGYTGEVGKEIVRELLEKKIFKKLFLIGRRQVIYDDPLYTNAEQLIVDFDHLENRKDAFQCEYGFCCLGTTRAAAGAEGFYKIEHDYALNCAKMALEMGCKRFSTVSASTANKDSWLLYNKTKGLAELHISEVPFDKVTVARPAFLLSDRNKTRIGERIATCTLAPIIWAKPTFISIPTTKVAKAIIYNMCSDPIRQRVEFLNNGTLHEIADNLYDNAFPSNN